jgi:hypothetical protein
VFVFEGTGEGKGAGSFLPVNEAEEKGGEVGV